MGRTYRRDEPQERKLENKELKIGIVGLGKVGTALKYPCKFFYKQVFCFDIVGKYDWPPLLGSDVVFTCVQTPQGSDGRLDCRQVEEVLTKLDNDHYEGIVAIKSTVRVGFMEKACDLHPYLRLIYNPEFLREKSSLQWTIDPDRIVVSGDSEDAKTVRSVYVWAENAKTIITDFRSAEIGKLAHNARIATMVSFTNEMERISQEFGANPEDVMDIVSSDRRVMSKEHLKPNLGPYSGKCVPKDSKELMNASKSEFLKAVENVNEKTKLRYCSTGYTEEPKQRPQKEVRVVAIIPTKARRSQLEKAIMTVAGQTRQPDELIIIGEDEADFPLDKTTIESKFGKTKIHWLLNSRTQNLSGAINTASQFLLSQERDPSNTYLALLDDDDAWESEYLQTVCEQATKERKDLIISGLIRHSTNDDEGIKQTIPDQLNQKMFLTGNPHIQGSNLFVKMSTFLKAGGFDENLPSTTDRDFMIRVLDLGDTTYSCIPKHLVHHYANSQERLSAYGSKVKIIALTRFLQKYEPRMTAQEIVQNKQRAKKLFGWTENVQNKQEKSHSNILAPRVEKTKHKFHLVIGFTASYISCASKLLQDIKDFQKNFPLPISLVILDNTEAPKQLEQLIMANKSGFATVRVISKNEVEKDAEAGKLGVFYINKERRKGPSYGRTALHRFLYLTGIEINSPVFWILDDDIRLDKIAYAYINQIINPKQLERIIDYLLEKKIAICIGGIMGDPPLPIANSIRGQLLELHSFLGAISKNTLETENKLGINDISSRFPDEYYDLSTKHYDHLETPLRVWALLGADPENLMQSIGSIMEGRNLLRPALPYDMKNLNNEKVIMRGGNTIVTDIECLRTYPNSSPQINGVELRRGDSLWVVLNQFLGGKLVGFENKRVVALPLYLRQERVSLLKPKLLNNSLKADIQGAAFVRAFANLLKRKRQKTASQGAGFIGATLRFSVGECEEVIQETLQNIELRQPLLILNAWRINGLISAIRQQLNDGIQENPTFLRHFSAEVEDLRRVLDWVEKEMSIPATNEFCQCLKTGVTEGVTDFMLELDHSREKYSSYLPLRAKDEQKKKAIQLIAKHFDTSQLRLIGEGQEGIVYTDGKKAYKYLISNISQIKNSTRKIIKTKLNPSTNLKRIITVEKLIIEKNEMLISMPFIEGKNYRGGRLTEFLELLRECKRADLALTNLCPDNLIVGKNGLIYVDVGRSIVPYQETLFIQMCKRAFLTYRWHFRLDLKELLTRSINEQNMPELFGFEQFMKAVEQLEVHSQMDTYLISECLKTNPKKVLDYGCGKGAVADELADTVCEVDCFDMDTSAFTSKTHKPTVKLLSIDDLNKHIEQQNGYDLLVCNLVLCAIESEKEVEHVSHKLRSLVSPNGHVIIGLCNPFSDEVVTSPSQKRKVAPENNYPTHFAITEITPKGNQRIDWHRPLSWYEHIFHKAGFEIKDVIEVPSVDIERLSPSSDQILLVLCPVQKPKQSKTVSLMIKASAMEWQTIEKQVRHIVSQLEGPQTFLEKILVTDSSTVGFARQYATANLEKFNKALQKLLEEHVIDRVISAPTSENEIKQIYHKWFRTECSKPRASNGQPTYMALYGLEQCKGDYVLQTDSDCIFFRRERSHDYLGEMTSVLESDPKAVTVALPIPYEETQPYKKESENRPFRVEVRCCLLDIEKLKSLLPLENETQNNQLKMPWHRSLDNAVQAGKATSYRGGNPQTCFVHIPNFRKTDVNDWMSIIDAAEAGTMISQQLNKIQLVGESADWLGKRNEKMILLLRGKNVPLSKVCRCVQSLQTQSVKNWSAVIIDACSSNGLDELCKYVLKEEFGDRVTLVHNHSPVSPMENIDIVTSSICTNQQSIIIHLDLDDALIGTEALAKVKEAYENGADVTVGSMLRTDKQAEYTVTFQNPRANRGGNVWQHLRTYRKYLYDEVPKDYFQVDGGWVKHSEDWAFMIPIVELAENPVNIKDTIYFYEPSEDKPNRNIQERETLIAKIIAKPSLEGHI